MIAAQRCGCSLSCSSTIRTARARTSGENLFVVLLVMAPSSQELEPPANPGRFRSPTAWLALLVSSATAFYTLIYHSDELSVVASPSSIFLTKSGDIQV